MEVMKDLGLALTNGESLEIIKKERGYIEEHIKQLKQDRETTFEQMKYKVNLLQSYDVLIQVFEKYLSQEF